MKKQLGLLVIPALVAVNTVSILSLNSCSVFVPQVRFNTDESYSFNIGTVISTSLSYDGFSDKDILEPVVDYDGHDEFFTVPTFTYKEDYVAVSFNCIHKNESDDTNFDLYVNWRIKYTSYEKNTSTTIHMIATNNIIINKSFKYNDAPSEYVPDNMLPTEDDISQNNSIDILNGIYNVAPTTGDYDPQLYMNPCSKEQNTNSNVSNYLCSDFAYFTNLFADNNASLSIVKGWLNYTLNKNLLLFKVDLEYDPVHQIFNRFIFSAKGTGTLLTKNDSVLTFSFALKNVSDLEDDDYGHLTNGVQLLSAFTTDTSGMSQGYIDGTSKISSFSGGVMANHDVGFPHFYPSGQLITGNFLNIVPSQNLPENNGGTTDHFDESASYWSQTCELNAPILGDQTYSFDSFGSDSHVYTAFQFPNGVGDFAFPESAAAWQGLSTMPSYALSKIDTITPCTIDIDQKDIPSFSPVASSNIYWKYMKNMEVSDYWKSPDDYSAVLYCRIIGNSWDDLTYNGNTIPAQMGKLSWYKVCNLAFDTPRTDNYQYAQDRYFYGSSVAYDYCIGDIDPRLKNQHYTAGIPCDERSSITKAKPYTRFGVPLAYGFNCSSMAGAIDYTTANDGFTYHTDKSDNVFKFTETQLEQLKEQFP